MDIYETFTQHITRDKRGATCAAFFDLDGTLIDTHSVKAVFSEQLSRGDIGAAELVGLLSMSFRYLMKKGDFEEAMASSIGNMAGLDVQAYRELGNKVFADRLSAVIFPEMKAIIQRHRALGHPLVIITSATRFQVEALADYLDIPHVLCTELEVRDGKYTGNMDGPACYGDGKLAAARAFARQHGIKLAHSYFYSNGSEDLPLLEKVGHPVAINADKALRARAEQKQWTSYQPGNRSSTGLLDITRTLWTFGSVLPAVAAGLPFRWLGQKREATNFAVATWAELGSLIAGLKLRVEGEEHLWSSRPAVFIFNHQSAMDTLIMASLMRRDMTGIAKQEIRRQAIMGPALTALGAVFIDRENIKDPQAVLQPAVDALAEGKSVVIAPEGTRSRDEKLGEFKNGAFHLARQAGVPVVPVVIHNALDALPSKKMVIRPAEVKVTVLEPVPTSRWTGKSVAANARRIRTAFLKTLGQAAPGGS